ncbi:ferredoxin--NADP reductase [Methanolobus chelungpuianus]|uniref:Xylene monooxygenase n=1 Tax=Methanolobus chelungpuianus TaxID=502115 RepID=A0AAE3HAJ7_9EURY|nr:FAD-binding oxidoreductase [Methanolobus chelungpuianus]MCQ6962559.1 xylene monooxygenase [Methanolobus chelungpuianus]
MKFQAHVSEIIRRSEHIKSFRFRRPEDFDYKAGQYIVVTLDVNGKSISKPFSLSSSPTEKEHLEFTKKLTGHEYSDALDSMVKGDTFNISGPYGKMTYEGEYEKIALLSGGIGITPMRSICRYCTDMSLDTDIVLICSDRSEEDMIFWKELSEMLSLNPHLKVFQTLTRASEGWTGSRDRISETLVRRELPDYAIREFYICGPPPMVDSMVEILRSLSIPDMRIKKESLIGY